MESCVCSPIDINITSKLNADESFGGYGLKLCFSIPHSEKRNVLREVQEKINLEIISFLESKGYKNLGDPVKAELKVRICQGNLTRTLSKKYNTYSNVSHDLFALESTKIKKILKQKLNTPDSSNIGGYFIEWWINERKVSEIHRVILLPKDFSERKMNEVSGLIEVLLG
jgi:hypothetical protein